jgi:hypothetical protein
MARLYSAREGFWNHPTFSVIWAARKRSLPCFVGNEANWQPAILQVAHLRQLPCLLISGQLHPFERNTTSLEKITQSRGTTHP